MLQCLREHIEGLDGTPTKIDISSIELYFYDLEITTYDVYVRYRAQRRKTLPHFQNLLRGLDKYSLPNQVAYQCVRQASSDGFVTDEDILRTMRSVYSEVLNNRTGKMEIDAPSGAYKDVCRRIRRVGTKLGKDIIIHRLALPPAHGQELLTAYTKIAKSVDSLIQEELQSASFSFPRTAKEREAGATMVTRLSAHASSSVRLTVGELQRGVDIAAQQLANRDHLPTPSTSTSLEILPDD